MSLLTRDALKIPVMIFLYAMVIGLSVLSLLPVVSDIFTISLPIAVKRGFPIPVLLWVIIGLYIYACSRIMSISPRRLVGEGLLLGFVIHILFLMLRLQYSITASPSLISSRWYYVYCNLFITVCFICFSSYFSWRLARTKPLHDIVTIPSMFFLVYMLISMIRDGRSFDFSIVLLSGLAAYITSRSFFFVERIHRFKKALYSAIGRESVYLPAISIAAFIIRIFYLQRVMSKPNFLFTGSDAALYDGLARRFLAGLPVTDSYASGYWLFLAAVYKVFGTEYFAIGAVQAVFSCLSGINIYYAVKYAFNRAVGIGVLLFATVNFPLIFSSVAIGYQVMDVFYSTLILRLAIMYILKIREGARPKLLLMAIGALSGIAIANRETNVFFPFVLVCWLVILSRAWFKRVGLALKDGALILIFSTIALLPFVARNISQTGVWFPVFTTSEGYNIIPVNAAMKMPTHEEYTFSRYYSAYINSENKDLADHNINFLQPMKTVKSFIDNPAEFLGVISGNFTEKIKAMFFSQGYGGFDLLFLYRLSDYYYALWFYVYILTALGMTVACMKYLYEPQSLFVLFLAYRTSIHLITEAAYRHRASVEPYLLVYLSFGIYVVARYSTMQRRVTNA